MPRQGEHTPISDEEALEIVSRTISTGTPEEQVDAVRSTVDFASWERFVEDRIGPRQSQPVTSPQMQVFRRGMGLMYETLPSVDLTYEENLGRRGPRGRFRDSITGRFVSRSDVASRIGIFSSRDIRND